MDKLKIAKAISTFTNPPIICIPLFLIISIALSFENGQFNFAKFILLESISIVFASILPMAIIVFWAKKLNTDSDILMDLNGRPYIPGSSVTDYSFVSPTDCRCGFTGAEEQCLEKIDRETLRYLANNLSSAALARVTDIVVFAATLRADWRVSAAFFADGVLGAAINAHIYSKIMEGANKAKNENCSCSQYGY